MKHFCLVIFLLCFTSFAISQTSTKPKTIEETIDSIYKISSSWEYYKLVRKDRYQALKKEILDSLNLYKSEIRRKSIIVSKQQDSILNSKEVIDELSMEVKLSLDRRNEIKFLGVSIQKLTYQIIVWSIILVLIIALLYFTYKYKNSHIITKKAQNELSDLEEEFAAHKKNAMTREQKLRRQLQDEINKNRNS